MAPAWLAKSGCPLELTDDSPELTLPGYKGFAPDPGTWLDSLRNYLPKLRVPQLLGLGCK